MIDKNSVGYVKIEGCGEKDIGCVCLSFKKIIFFLKKLEIFCRDFEKN
jgi:hypothetical protein